MNYMVSYCSERGKGKQACEDSVLIGHQVINEEAGTAELSTPCRICICDGVGGVAGGQEASLFVARELSLCEDPESADDVKRLFAEINDRLLEQAAKSSDHKQMATTATAIFLSEKGVYLAHVGNTRLYEKHGTSLCQLTVDQTTYQWYMDHDQSELANEENRDVIYGAMGGDIRLLEPLVAEKLPEELLGRTMLLTSDGVYEHLSPAEIEEILNGGASLADQAKMLCSAALEHGSEDDRTVILLCAEGDLA